MRTAAPPLVALSLSLTLLTGCSGTAEAPGSDSGSSASAGGGPITVYCGRNERLVGPILERFESETGIEVQVRYGSTAELAATILEEGDRSPAHLFFGQDAGSLGALSGAGRLQPMPEQVLSRVPQRFRSKSGDWVGVSGRARVVVYNPERIALDALPQSLPEVADPKYKGKFGLAPTNASFQSHMALVAAVEGEDALDELLQGIVANDPQRYPKNSPIVQAVIAGEIEWGLVNHYYLWQALKQDPDAPARNFFMPSDGASGFLNLAGIGLIRRNEAAVRLAEYLLSDEAQMYFAEETFEYPLVDGIPPSVELPPLDSIVTPDVDFRDVADRFGAALDAISESGLTRFDS